MDTWINEMGLNKYIEETLTIPVLKAAAASHYKAYHNACDNMSCGKNLAEEISSTVATHKRKFNELMAKLKKIDPDCPDLKL